MLTRRSPPSPPPRVVNFPLVGFQSPHPIKSIGIKAAPSVHPALIPYHIGVTASHRGFGLARIHRWGAALGLEQGVRAVRRDGPRSIPINGAGGGFWLSLGAPMAVLGSGAGAGSAGQHAGEDNRGPGRCDSVGRLGSLVDGSGAVGVVRQAMAGLAIERGRE